MFNKFICVVGTHFNLVLFVCVMFVVLTFWHCGTLTLRRALRHYGRFVTCRRYDGHFVTTGTLSLRALRRGAPNHNATKTIHHSGAGAPARLVMETYTTRNATQRMAVKITRRTHMQTPNPRTKRTNAPARHESLRAFFL